MQINDATLDFSLGTVIKGMQIRTHGLRCYLRLKSGPVITRTKPGAEGETVGL